MKDLGTLNLLKGPGINYAGAKRAAARQQVRVQWVLEQVPLVEAEMAQATVAKAEEPSRMIRAKRRLTANEEPAPAGGTKRRKLYESRLETKSGFLTVMKPQVAQGNDNHGYDTGDGDVEAVSRGPRRSARIAARASKQAPEMVDF